jgi:hypothetical protein
VTAEAGKRLARELLSPDAGGFAAARDRIRARREAHNAEHSVEPAAGPGKAAPAPAGPRPGTRRNRLRHL